MDPSRLDLLEEAADALPSVPAWLACNPKRFPYWFGQPDPRNAALLAALREGWQGEEGEEKKLFLKAAQFRGSVDGQFQFETLE
jgi:hypothetical protein